MYAPLGIALLLAVAMSPVLRFWEQLPSGALPAEIAVVICGDQPDCRMKITRGPAFRADLDSDGKPEYLVPTGCDPAGCRFQVLSAGPAGGWIKLLDEQVPPLIGPPVPNEIFPRERKGHRDFRVSDLVMKWRGAAYVAYQAADFRSIQVGWLDERDPASAVLLWLRDYAGLKEFTLVPRYLPGSFGEVPQAALRSRVKDPKTGIDWLSFLKANLWASQPKQGRRFFVFPRLAPPGADLKMVGDWVVVYDEGKEAARIHRRTLRVRLAHPLGE